MKILITGASGFIGAQIVSRLLEDNHDVTCAVRDPLKLQQRFPHVRTLACNFNRDTTPEVWLPRLSNIDIVINCVGVLRNTPGEQMEAIHASTPCALFTACEKAAVKKVIQISAFGVEQDPDNPYNKTKLKADNTLLSLNIDSHIIRPSLVYGIGSYGGTSLLRSLAATPFFSLLIGDGEERISPLFVDDLAKTVSRLCHQNSQAPQIINLIGPEDLTVKNYQQQWRNWLGIKKAIFIKLPVRLVKSLMKLGDLFTRGPISSSLLSLLKTNSNINRHDCWKPDFTLSALSEVLAINPSQTQDLWHARLYLFRSLALVILGLFWILSGLLPFLGDVDTASQLLRAAGLPSTLLAVTKIGTCLLDILLGVGLMFSFKVKRILQAQVVLVSFYTVMISLFIPTLWLDPLGSVAKNIPVLLLTLFLLAIEGER